jgi:hypothetical protein
MPVPAIQADIPVLSTEEEERLHPSDAKGNQSPYSSANSTVEELDFAKNPFADPDVAAHWRQVYENSQYECRHVFDPTLTWSEQEEKAVVRKLEWRVCLWAVGNFASVISRCLANKRSALCSSDSRLIEATLCRLFQTTFSPIST